MRNLGKSSRRRISGLSARKIPEKIERERAEKLGSEQGIMRFFVLVRNEMRKEKKREREREREREADQWRGVRDFARLVNAVKLAERERHTENAVPRGGDCGV